MKKTFKKISTLFFLLALISTIKPIASLPQLKNNTPEITLYNDSDNNNADDRIDCY